MFCNQCEQTIEGCGCTRAGACGKTAEAAALQDLIVYAARGLALTALEAGKKGADIARAGRTCVAALFTTLTNVNFDPQALTATLRRVTDERARLASQASVSLSCPACTFTPASDGQTLLEQANQAAVTELAPDPDRTSLARILLFGLKGAAAYTDHAAALGYEDTALYAALFAGLAFGFDGRTPTLEEWTEAALACGHANLKAMELLDAANTGTYGHPEPTEVSLTPRPGKAILISGHDLRDLHELLAQTEGTGIQVYTHGEMLPAHGYPGLKRFSHLAGHFGTAWQNQTRELADFPGAVLFTTNCIQRPAESYRENIFTTGQVGWPGVRHVENRDFRPVIERALSLEGFTDSRIAGCPPVTVQTGFARNAVLSMADKIVQAVRSGEIRRFFLVGGCDGARPGRSYYSELVEKTPPNTLVLTLGCGKFRFFDKNLGSINGIPRLLDMGQCNDAFSAVAIAQALADAFSCQVNDLPLSLVLSWYEQKAVAVLLSLLALGIKGIRLGPTLPAFVTPAVLRTLVERFDLKPITTPDEDLKAMLG